MRAHPQTAKQKLAPTEIRIEGEGVDYETLFDECTSAPPEAIKPAHGAMVVREFHHPVK